MNRQLKCSKVFEACVHTDQELKHNSECVLCAYSWLNCRFVSKNEVYFTSDVLEVEIEASDRVFTVIIADGVF